MRLFFKDPYKGQIGYLKTQLRYEIARTLLYFGICLGLVLAGFFATGSRLNWLTLFAVLGCLPSCQSLVSVILFAKAKPCSEALTKDILDALQEAAKDAQDAAKDAAQDAGKDAAKDAAPAPGLFDLAFTAYDTTFYIAHLYIKNNTVIGICEMPAFDEAKFNKHFYEVMRNDGFSNISGKIFTDKKKYLARLKQIQALEADVKLEARIKDTILAVTL